MTNNKFKVGQRVRIRSRESMKKEFGLRTDGVIACRSVFCCGMRDLCGATAEVLKIKNDGEIILSNRDISTSVDTDRKFSADMLEPADQNESEDECSDDSDECDCGDTHDKLEALKILKKISDTGLISKSLVAQTIFAIITGQNLEFCGEKGVVKITIEINHKK